MQGLPAYIHFNKNPNETILSILNELSPDKVAILVDENTRKHCLPLLENSLTDDLIFETESGEQNKNLATCSQVWDQMTLAGLSRKSILINLGGGVIGDMGGFIASTYKRGIRFINIPTTLLSQVDASIGGKLGVDFNGLKNHIGVFRDPDAVILSDIFLNTLDRRQLMSGFAEVIKHGLIWDASYFHKIKQLNFPEDPDWDLLLQRSVEIKGEVVTEDPLEHGLRKILNFGHTLGHAVETYHLENGIDMLHGEAIAIGMIMEMHLSHQLGYLELDEIKELSQWIMGLYGYVDTIPSIEDLIALMIHDKKNDAGSINFSLLEKVGTCRFDERVDNQQISNAVNFYHSIAAR
jgi:3-dehydroquinate synthase